MRCYLKFVLLFLVLLHSIFEPCFSETYYHMEGTWEIYEGGNIGPDILILNEDGTGIAYRIINTYESWSI